MEIPVNNYNDGALVDKLTDEIMVSMAARDDYGYLRAIDYDKQTVLTLKYF